MENMNNSPKQNLSAESAPITPEEMRQREGLAIYRQIMMTLSLENNVPANFSSVGREHRVATVPGAVIAYFQAISKSAQSVHGSLIKTQN